MNKKILLVDGSNIVFRAYFALQRSGLTSKSGKPSGAIFGFLRMLCDVISKEKPDSVLVAFDPSVTFRHEKYAYYKANRPTETPPDLVDQFPEVERFLKYLGIPSMVVKGIEADDIIGSVSHQASTIGYDVLVFSGDKDNFQLVNNRVTIIYPDIKGGYKLLDSDGVKEKLGVLPNQVIDFKALSGDSSDNIKGVPGVGPKTAINLIDKYETLNNIFSHLDEITPAGVQEKLRNNKESAYESQWLATIKLDAEIAFDYENFSLEVDAKMVAGFLEEYSLNTLKKQLPDIIKQFNPKFSDSLEVENGLFSETDIENTLSSVQISTNINDVPKNIELTVHKITSGYEVIWQKDYVQNTFAKVVVQKGEVGEILNKARAIFVWDGKNTLLKDVDISVPVFDVLLGVFVENNLNPLTISEACKHIIGSSTGEEGSDVGYLGEHLLQNLGEKQRKLWLDLESPLLAVLAHMETVGVYLSKPKLSELSKTLNDLADKMEKQIKSKLELPEINVNSSQQLGQALTDKGHKLPLTGKTKNFSTDREALENLLENDTDGVIADILEYRTVTKLSSTFTDSFLEKLDEKSRIHTEYSQVVAATGRLSSSNPNLQNIPIRNSIYGPLIRACFCAPKGRVIIAADYSQMELRLLAHFCNDENLKKAFINGEDIHARTAAEMFGIEIKDVTKEQRSIGKTLNFALVYQQGAFSTAKQLGVSQKEAKEFIELYFNRFPNVKPYVEKVLQNAREKGYAETLFGRRRYFKNLESKNFMMRSLDERAAFNAGLQGSNADMTKKAMIGIQNEIDAQGLKSLMILQVHDELVFEVPMDEVEVMKKIIETQMKLGDILRVPVQVDIGVGENWAEAK